MKQTILVTGAAGYIGTDLVETLLQQGYKVRAIDRLYFGPEKLQTFKSNPDFELLVIDSRSLQERHFQGVFAVCDLVAMSNDPSGDLNPLLTQEINHLGRVQTAKHAKRSGVTRYILFSSCSVYGAGTELNLKEDAAVNPLTAYSKASYAAELDVLALASNDFSVTIMRNATVFGLSRRMRFDLVVNLMVLTAFETGKIIITGGGDQWRPLVHLHDISVAVTMILTQNPKDVNCEIFNIGRENIKVKTLAYQIREALDSVIEIQLIADDPDKRDYHISFEKAAAKIGFIASTTIEEGAIEVHRGLISGEISRTDKTSTVGWYKKLVEAEKLYKSLNIDGNIF